MKMIDEKLIDDIRNTWTQWRILNEKLKNIKRNRPFNEITISSVFGALTAMDFGNDEKMFVIIYIFTPEVLAGIRMRVGYREYFSKLFKYNTGCAISNRLRNLMFKYKNYSDFNDKVNEGVSIAERVLESMKK